MSILMINLNKLKLFLFFTGKNHKKYRQIFFCVVSTLIQHRITPCKPNYNDHFILSHQSRKSDYQNISNLFQN